MCSDMNNFVSELKGLCILIGPIKIKIVTQHQQQQQQQCIRNHGLTLHDRLLGETEKECEMGEAHAFEGFLV